MASIFPLSSPAPRMLLVPGSDEHTARDWLADWERAFPDAVRLDLGGWDAPHRNTWVNRLNLAIHRAGRPVVLVAEGIATLAVAWWAEYEQPDADALVAGALLVDAPDIDRPGSDPRVAALTACPRAPLPFAACLLATRSRGAAELRGQRQLARDWGATFDTIAAPSLLTPPALLAAQASPVRTLGQRFLLGLAGPR